MLPHSQMMRPPAESFRATQPRLHIPIPVYALFGYLAAITIFGKGPTYLIHPPFFLGEMVMLLATGWMTIRLVSYGIHRSFIRIVSIPVLLFMLLGTARLPGDYSRWGMLALRDAALWYYGVFYFLGLCIASQPRVADWLWRKLVWVWLAAMAWYLVLRLTKLPVVSLSPKIPWRGVPLFAGSSSENVQHMSMGAILLLLGLPRPTRSVLGYTAVIAGILLSAFVLLGTSGRGVKIAVLVGWTVGFLCTAGSGKSPWPAGRKFLVLYIFCVAIGIAAIASGPSGLYSAGRLQRFEALEHATTKGTAYWRITWWRNIWREVADTSPAYGLGLGYDLHSLNPFLQGHEWKYPVRAAHNINVTIFARMGFMGLSLWLLTLLLGVGRLLVRVWRGGTRHQGYNTDRYKELAFWLIFLIATYLNGCFGVLIEGPVLGIWFWFALGFALGRSEDPTGFDYSPASEPSSMSDIPLTPVQPAAGSAR